ncbi:hypothetical protein Q7C36_013070 [Tachysurus vachellii]|uniref:Secreted protein n=1 Tax=Tachysurus vachellii TaxID=175792 RepID=A0AA88MSD2_TACVA|nr:hypothetical protein Q7C36_013070 [Tachysurus vachellii]
MINPVTFLLTLACLREMCLENNSCRPEQTGYTSCIIKNCGKALKPCAHKTIQEIVTEMKKEDPSASTLALQQEAGAAVLENLQSVLHCFRKINESLIDTTFCFIDAFLGDSEQHNDHEMPTFMSSDTGYISCWIKAAGRGYFSCFDHYDLKSLQSLQEHFAGSFDNFHCFLKKFPSLSEKCLPASIWLYGELSLAQLQRLAKSSEELLDCGTMWSDTWKQCMHESSDLPGANRTLPTEAKDVYVCAINEIIRATAMC